MEKKKGKWVTLASGRKVFLRDSEDPDPQPREGKSSSPRERTPRNKRIPEVGGGSKPAIQPKSPLNPRNPQAPKAQVLEEKAELEDKLFPWEEVLGPAMAFSFPQTSPSPFQAQQQQQQQQPQPQFQIQPQQPQFQIQAQQPQFQIQPPQPQFQMQLPQQPTFLFKTDKSPASYNTKWEELHPDSQKYLLEIETRILEYRSESQRLDQCKRLSDSSISVNGFEADATRIIQELRGISILTDREKNSVQELMTAAKEMMRNAEFAIRSFMILHPRFAHQISAAPSASTGGITQQTAGPTIAHDFYSGVPKRPSQFFVDTVNQLEKSLAECQQWIEEIEQLLNMENRDAFSGPSFSLESLPSVLSNVHDYFIYTAAKVENLHQYIESMKTAYLADQRRRGNFVDPFIEAGRRETAKLEAAARRVHPTLHLPAVPSQSTAPGMPSAASTSSASAAPTAAASGVAPASSLFSTPQATPSSSLFGPGPSALSPQPPSLFGTGTPSFTPTPAVGSSPVFSVPSFPSGGALASGASFGGSSKTTKPKSRTSRR